MGHFVLAVAKQTFEDVSQHETAPEVIGQAEEHSVFELQNDGHIRAELALDVDDVDENECIVDVDATVDVVLEVPGPVPVEPVPELKPEVPHMPAPSYPASAVAHAPATPLVAVPSHAGWAVGGSPTQHAASNAHELFTPALVPVPLPGEETHPPLVSSVDSSVPHVVASADAAISRHAT